MIPDRLFRLGAVSFTLLAFVVASASHAAPARSGMASTVPAGQEAVLRAGRSVGALVAKGDATAIFARFTTDMAAAVPQEKIDHLLRSVVPDISSRQPLEETVTPEPQQPLVTYAATYAWKGDGRLALTVTFLKGSGGKIAGLLLRVTPPKTLPSDPHAGYRLKALLHLPFAPGDSWTVVWGGDTRAQNYHVDAPDQRHAYDLLVVENGVSHRGDGSRLDQYYAWGRRILAPASGTVIEAVNDLADNAIGQRDAAHAAGNHVLLDLGGGEYALLAHLQHGSVQVKAGNRVITGQWLGLCGNSGNTSEPHLHFHVQDKPYLFQDALGLPVVFSGYRCNGKALERGTPVQGERLENSPP